MIHVQNTKCHRLICYTAFFEKWFTHSVDELFNEDALYNIIRIEKLNIQLLFVPFI